MRFHKSHTWWWTLPYRDGKERLVEVRGYKPRAASSLRVTDWWTYKKHLPKVGVSVVYRYINPKNRILVRDTDGECIWLKNQALYQFVIVGWYRGKTTETLTRDCCSEAGLAVKMQNWLNVMWKVPSPKSSGTHVIAGRLKTFCGEYQNPRWNIMNRKFMIRYEKELEWLLRSLSKNCSVEKHNVMGEKPLPKKGGTDRIQTRVQDGNVEER